MSKKILSDEDDKTLCEKYKNGYSVKKLSLEYNICEWSVCNILKKYKIITRIRKYKLNENFFELIDNENKSYWLGFLFADGCVRKRQHKNGSNAGGNINLKLQTKDESHLEKFKKDLDCNYTIRKDIIDKSSMNNFKNNLYYTSTLSLFSNKMSDDLIRHGCLERKSLILKSPNIDKEYIRHFIRGYFDGDGCISKFKIRDKDRFTITIIGTENLLSWISNYFFMCGCSNKILHKKDNVYNLRYSKTSDISLIKHILYDDSTLCLERKKIKFQGIKEIRKQKLKNLNLGIIIHPQEDQILLLNPLEI